MKIKFHSAWAAWGPCVALAGSVAVAAGCSSSPPGSGEPSAREQQATSVTLVGNAAPTLLIVTDDALAPALTPLINHKNATGMPTGLATVAQFVQQFPVLDVRGNEDKAASVKLGIDYYYRTASTQYVFLVGDETHVPARYTGILPNQVTNPADAHAGVGFRQSDLYYADLRTTPAAGESPAYSSWDANGDSVFNAVAYGYSAFLYNPDEVDGLPEVAVGRLDVDDVTSVSNYVTKVIAYETTPSSVAGNATVINDALYGGGEGMALGIANRMWVAGSMAYGEINNSVNGTTPAAPWTAYTNAAASLTQAAANSGWVFYVGHGWQGGWDGPDYTTWDAMTQANLPIVGAAGCQTGLYTAWSQDDHVDHPDTFPWGTMWYDPPTAPDAPQAAPSSTLSNHVLATNSIGGGIAYMGETQVMPNTEGTEFFEDLANCYSSSTHVGALGDLYRCAQTAYWNANDLYWTDPTMQGDILREPRIYLSIMTLFGDPSLRLPSLMQPATAVAGTLQVEGKCMALNSGNTANGTPVDIWDCDGSTSEQWTMASDGTIRFTAQPSKCLDLTAGNETDGTLLQIWDCQGPTGGPHQHWSLGANGALTGPGGKCVDDPYFNTTDGTTLDYWDCNGGTNQQFVLEPATPTPPVMSTPGSLQVEGKCMDLTAGNTTNGTPVQIWDCASSAHQEWVTGSDGTIRYAAEPSKCLDLTAGNETDGTKLQIWDCAGPTGGAHQHWSLEAGGALVGPGGKCVDDPYSNTTNGTVFDYWDCNGGASQQITFFSGSGTFQIEGKCMDLVDGNTSNGMPVQIWDCVGGTHQSWVLGSDGTVRYAAQPSKCLDLTAGNEADGTLIQIWDCAGPTGGPHQHWTPAANGQLIGPGDKCVDNPSSNTTDGTLFDYWDCNLGANQKFTYVP